MECPKCGNSMYRQQDYTDEKVYTMCSCGIKLTEKEYKYQQRLDKVLSKFEVGYGSVKYHIDERTELYWFENKFRINYDDQELSLKTVESILEDLEGDE